MCWGRILNYSTNDTLKSLGAEAFSVVFRVLFIFMKDLLKSDQIEDSTQMTNNLGNFEVKIKRRKLTAQWAKILLVWWSLHALLYGFVYLSQYPHQLTMQQLLIVGYFNSEPLFENEKEREQGSNLRRQRLASPIAHAGVSRSDHSAATNPALALSHSQKVN